MKCDRCAFETKPGAKRPDLAMGRHLLTHLGEKPRHDPAHLAKVNAIVDAIKREQPQPAQQSAAAVPNCSKCERPLNLTVTFGNGTFARVPTFFHVGQTEHYQPYECMDDATLTQVARTRTPVRSAR